MLGRCDNAEPAAVFAALLDFGLRSTFDAADAARLLVTCLLGDLLAIFGFYAMAGIKGASSHSGRRQFLTELADKGINVRVIQALARHKDIRTTQRYIDYNESKLRNAIELS